MSSSAATSAYPAIVIGIDEVADKQWNCASAMPSQLGDKHSWQVNTLLNIPRDNKEVLSFY